MMTSSDYMAILDEAMRLTEPKKVYAEMLAMVESTHWSQEALACPVYEMRRVRVVNMENKSGFGWSFEADLEKPPIKITYCAMGLMMRVVYGEDKVAIAGEPDTAGTFVNTPKTKAILREQRFISHNPEVTEPIIAGLWEVLPDESKRDAEVTQWSTPRARMDAMVADIEMWNDDVDRDQVIATLKRAVDAASAA